jgi:chromosome segregation ATPase
VEATQTPDQQLQIDVDKLRAQFSNTAELYREVCALMFFRYGQTPTANRLYQLVRKGSMSAPASALSAFWNTLRAQSRVQIEHADLPEPLKKSAADLTMALWKEARQHAEQAFDAQRGEAAEALSQTLARLSSVQAELDALRETHAAQQEVLQGARAAHLEAAKTVDDLQQTLAATTAAHREALAVRDEYAKAQQRAAALRETELREAATRRETEQRDAAAQREAALRDELSGAQANLAAAHEAHRRAMVALQAESRDALAGIQARYDAQHKHNLLELDRERQRAAQLDKALTQANAQLAVKTEAASAAAATWQEAAAAWQGKVGALEGRLAAMGEERARLDAQRVASDEARQHLADRLHDAVQESARLRTELAAALEDGGSSRSSTSR